MYKRQGCDIVLVTLNESLEEYAKGYEEQLGYLYPYPVSYTHLDVYKRQQQLSSLLRILLYYKIEKISRLVIEPARTYNRHFQQKQ